MSETKVPWLSVLLAGIAAIAFGLGLFHVGGQDRPWFNPTGVEADAVTVLLDRPTTITGTQGPSSTPLSATARLSSNCRLTIRLTNPTEGIQTVNFITMDRTTQFEVPASRTTELLVNSRFDQIFLTDLLDTMILDYTPDWDKCPAAPAEPSTDEVAEFTIIGLD